jgi:pimeloyl-ACP methyl ester carboxylesterase
LKSKVKCGNSSPQLKTEGFSCHQFYKKSARNTPSLQNKPHVVILHGVLMPALAMFYLTHQLRKSGFIVHSLSYQSVIKTPAENAFILHKKILNLNLNNLHIVAHSLGGIVSAHLLAYFDDIPKGNIVMLGTPISGSWFANRLCYVPILNKMLANSMVKGLSGKKIPDWKSERHWGMIAGQSSFGLAIIAGGLPEKGDGTVMLKETQHKKINAHITLPVSHTGMLFSKDVARFTASFLKTDCFPSLNSEA